MNRHSIRDKQIIGSKTDHASELRELHAISQQTIFILLGTVESYFGERLPETLLGAVEQSCHALVQGAAATGSEITWSAMKLRIDAEVAKYREELATKKAQTEAALAAGVLPL